LSTLVSQTYQDIELIILDDCSEGFLKDEILEYLNNNARSNLTNLIVEQNQHNLGVIKNYEKALSLATGEYIFYLAIDDMLYDEKVLEDVVDFFHTGSYKIFTGLREEISSNGNKIIKPRSHEVQFMKSNNRQSVYNKLLRYNFIVGACTPFKRELITQYGFVDNGYKHLEDWPRYLSLLEKGVDIGIYDRLLIRYRKGGITSSDVLHPDIIRDFAKMRKDFYKDKFENLVKCMKEKKKIIGWGAAGDFIISHKKWSQYSGREIEYLVDSDANKWGTEIEGIPVHAPQILSEEHKEDIFIIVYSADFYIVIAERLEGLGFIEERHFELVCKNLINVLDVI
jgi:glycosyltransferase involved in cell wall biosynthesis